MLTILDLATATHVRVIYRTGKSRVMKMGDYVNGNVPADARVEIVTPDEWSHDSHAAMVAERIGRVR